MKTKADNFLEELENYFNETPREKILADWEETKEWDNVGPTVEEYFEYLNNIPSQLKGPAN